jgi:PAS domain-containing protein
VGTRDGCPLYLVVFENASNESDIYQLLLNHSNSMVYISDSKTYEMLYANKPARDYRGEADNSYVGRKCYDYIRGEKEPCSWCFLGKVKRGEFYKEDRFIESRGVYQHIAGELVNWCGREAFVQYVDDITESRKLQKELENSQKMYRLAVEGAQLGVWEYDIRCRRIVLPESASTLAGFPRVMENVPESMLPKIEPQDRDKFLKMYKDINSGVPQRERRAVGAHAPGAAAALRAPDIYGDKGSGWMSSQGPMPSARMSQRRNARMKNTAASCRRC